MPTVEHNTLTTTELHEPKGVASATSGQVYFADGAGSGTWASFPTGWGFYSDNASAQTFNTTAAKLSINGSGTATNEDYLPVAIRGTDSLWDSTGNKITPILVGDAYDIRLDLPVTAKTGSPNSLTVEFDIGGGASPSIVVVTRTNAVTTAPPYTISIGLPLFSLTSFKTNGCQIFLKTDTGTVDVTAPGILVKRDHSGAI